MKYQIDKQVLQDMKRESLDLKERIAMAALKAANKLREFTEISSSNIPPGVRCQLWLDLEPSVREQVLMDMCELYQESIDDSIRRIRAEWQLA